MNFSPKVLVFATFLTILSGKSCDAQELATRCEPAPENGVSVLIGRFITNDSSSDDSLGAGHPPSDGDRSETVIQTVVATSLRSDAQARQLGASVTIWDTRSTQGSSDDAIVQNLLDKAFSRGALSDQGSDRDISVLSSELRDRRCGFVIGGEVRRGKDVTVIAPYLIDVARGTVEAPFRPIAVSRGDGLIPAGLELGARLGAELDRRRQPNEDTYASLLIGCFDNRGKDPKQYQKAAYQLTHSVATQLSGDPDYGAGARPLNSPCDNDEAASLSKARRAILFSGLVIRDDARLLVQPLFEVFVPGRVSPLLSVSMDPIEQIGPPSTNAVASQPDGLSRQYLSEVKTFVVALRSRGFEDALRDETRQVVGTATDAEGFAKELGTLVETMRSNAPKTAKREDAMARVYARAYAVLTAASNPSKIAGLSHYALGAALQADSENHLAVEQLTRSFQLDKNFPRIASAQRFETLGLAYKELGASDAAVSTLADAAKLYLPDHPIDASRALKTSAGVRLSINDLPGAMTDLETVPNFKNDIDTLALLGDVSFNHGEYKDSVEWFREAIALKDAPELKLHVKLARAYAAMGAPDKYGCFGLDAEENLLKALKEDDNPYYRLRVGLLQYTTKRYADAIDNFRRVIDADNASFQWAEAAWLDLIESEILAGDFAKADEDAEKASAVFAKIPDSQLLASYLRTLARALESPDADDASLKQDPVYKETMNEAATKKATSLLWDNSKLSKFYHDKFIHGDIHRSPRLDTITELETSIGIPPLPPEQINPMRKNNRICPA
jgi:tetratricopeptide (TPR) repeat protein